MTPEDSAFATDETASSASSPEVEHDRRTRNRLRAVGRFADLIEIIKRLSALLWREAVDFSNHDWPPTWLRVIGYGFVAALAAALVPLAARIVQRLTEGTVLTWPDKTLARIILGPVRKYLEDSAAGLGLSPVDLWTTWKLAGFVFFLASMIGILGGRIAWAVFGILTVVMVWVQTVPRSASWLAAGLTLLTWAALSLVTYGRRVRELAGKTEKPSRRRRPPNSRGGAGCRKTRKTTRLREPRCLFRREGAPVSVCNCIGT
jgi:hypothetical protein